jgi:hypothetical protein
MRRSLLVLVAAACLVLLVAASSAPAKRADDCSWGASSVIAEVVNGQVVQSEPETSGCVPPH